MTSVEPQFTLTSADVRRWEEERDQLLAQAKELNRRIDAAYVFLPRGAPRSDEVPTAATASSLNDWIYVVIGEAEKALQPRDIRMAVAAKGFDPGAENYIYTALKRMVEREQLVKTEHGYMLAYGSSKEETPDHEDGGLFSAITPEGGAGETVPEAGGT